MNIEVNHVAVLAATIASMITGLIWYVLFAGVLKRVRSLTVEQEQQLQKQSGVMYGVGLLLSLVMAEVLAHFVTMSHSFSGLSTITNGLVTAFVVYAGFVVPVQATHIIFGNYGALSKKLKLFGINTGGQLVSLLTMGIVLGLMPR